MKLNNINSNIKLVISSSLLFTKQNIIILSFLVLFTAINMVLISFCFDMLTSSFIQSDAENSLLILENTYPITSEVIPCLSMEQDLNTNKVFIFNSFIDLFHKNPSVYKYFPSYFQTFVNNKNDIIINEII
jgi:hypothetical protein